MRLEQTDSVLPPLRIPFEVVLWWRLGLVWLAMVVAVQWPSDASRFMVAVAPAAVALSFLVTASWRGEIEFGRVVAWTWVPLLGMSLPLLGSLLLKSHTPTAAVSWVIGMHLPWMVAATWLAGRPRSRLLNRSVAVALAGGGAVSGVLLAVEAQGGQPASLIAVRMALVMAFAGVFVVVAAAWTRRTWSPDAHRYMLDQPA